MIKFVTTGSLNVSGTITADGQSGGAEGSGCCVSENTSGGAGGSIWLQALTLTGSGTIRARGGAFGTDPGGGGGGGRISISATTTDTSSFTLQANGGVGDTVNCCQNGGAGTMYRKTPGAAFGTLVVDNANLATSQSAATTQVASTASTFDAVTIRNGARYLIPSGATLTVASGGTLTGGGTQRPSLSTAAGGTFNAPGTAFTVSVIDVVNDGDFGVVTDLTLADTTFRSGNGFPAGLANLTISATSTFEKSGTSVLNVSGTIHVLSGGTMTHVANTTSGAGKQHDLSVTGGILTIDAGGSVNANARGFASSEGPGQGSDGGASPGAGGGYGGAGGAGAGAGGTTYGTAADPVDLGSGGGSFGATAGGAGGGELRFDMTGAITVNGTLSANGGSGASFSGGGSGGSVRLIVPGTVAGSGAITANGGTVSGAGAGCGGGGRIAIDYHSFTNSGTTTANAGTGCTAPQAGQNGSIVLNQTITVTLTAPNGGQTFTAFDTTSVTWSNLGPIDHYRISLSTDSGATFPTVIADDLAGSPYLWTVNNVQTTQARILIEGLNASDVVLASDMSDADFTINAVSVTVTAPAGGENLAGGQPFDVTWTDFGPIDHYRILFSTDSGATFPTVVATSTGASPFAWTVPNITTTQGRIRVEAYGPSDDLRATDDSADFSITQTLVTVSDPDGGENLAGGQLFDVAWTSSGIIDHFRIALSTDSGATFPTVVSSNATSPYEWTVNNVQTTQGRIRVEALDASNNVLNSDISDADFTITQTAVTVMAPDGGESLAGNQPFDIEWTSGGLIDHFRILLSTDSGATYPTEIADDVTGSPYAWTVPNIDTTQARVRVQALDGADTVLAFDDSDADFQISDTGVTVTDPDGGESLAGNQPFNVTWTDFGPIDHFRVLLSTDSGATFPTEVADDVTGSPYAWTVPNITTTQARIRVEARTSGGALLAADASNADFSITQSLVTVSSPNGGENWARNSTHDITWTESGLIDHFRITYSDDGGATFPTLVADDVATSPYAWQVPSQTTNDARIRVEALNASDVVLGFDDSDADFRIFDASGPPEPPPPGGGGGGISPIVTVIRPNGGETLTHDMTYTVEWAAQGSMTGIRLSYTRDNGATYATIADGLSWGSGSYQWDVPSFAEDATVFLRAEATENGNVVASDRSDNAFTIIADPALAGQPPSGEPILSLVYARPTEAVFAWNPDEQQACPGCLYAVRDSISGQWVVPAPTVSTAAFRIASQPSRVFMAQTAEDPDEYVLGPQPVYRSLEDWGLVIKVGALDQNQDYDMAVWRKATPEDSPEIVWVVEFTTPFEYVEFEITKLATGSVPVTVQTPAGPRAGNSFSYRLTIKNVGTHIGTFVTFEDRFPVGAYFHAGSLTADGVPQTDADDGDFGHYDAEDHTARWFWDEIGPGESHVVEVAMDVPGNAQPANVARITVPNMPAVTSVSHAPEYPQAAIEPIVLRATATDTRGITQISIYLDINTNPQPVKTCVFTTPQPSATCEGQASPVELNGNHTTTVRAFDAEGNAASGAETWRTSNPVPFIEAVDPAIVTVGGDDRTVGLIGRGFAPGMAVFIDGQQRQVINSNPTSAGIMVLKGDMDEPADLEIHVVNPAPGGGTSNSVTLKVVHAPTVSLTHAPEFPELGQTVRAIAAGSDEAGVTRMTVSVQPQDGSPTTLRTCTFVPAVTEATCDAEYIPTIRGSYSFNASVVNVYGLGAGTAHAWRTTNGVPVLDSIEPSLTGISNFSKNITLFGSEFVRDSVVLLDGSPRNTEFGDAGTLVVHLASTDGNVPGEVRLRVRNPAPGGGLSEERVLRFVPGPTVSVTHAPQYPDAGDVVTFTASASDDNGIASIRIAVTAPNGNPVTIRTCDGGGQPEAACTATYTVPALGAYRTEVFTTNVFGLTGSGFEDWRTVNPVPVITAIDPQIVVAGSLADFSLEGRLFVRESVARFEGVGMETRYGSETSLTFRVPRERLAQPGFYDVTVFNPAPGGGESNAVTIRAVAPPTAAVTHAPEFPDIGDEVSFTATAEDLEGIKAMSVYLVGPLGQEGLLRTCRFAPAVTKAECPSTFTIASLGSYRTRVTATNVFDLEAQASEDWQTVHPVPQITSVSPDLLAVGSGDTGISVTGVNFIQASVVRANGVALETRVGPGLNPTTLAATLPKSFMTAAGDIGITVFNPTPGGGLSNELKIRVRSGPKGTVTHAPQLPSDTDEITLTARFTDDTGLTRIEIRLPGAGIEGDLVRACTFAEPVLEGTCVGTVTGVALGWYTTTASAANVFGLTGTATELWRTQNPVPVLDSIDPGVVAVRSGSQLIRLIGRNFVPESVARLGGSDRQTLFVNPNELLMQALDSDVATVGTRMIAVFTPAPAGGTSEARPLEVVRRPVVTNVWHDPAKPMPFDRVNLWGSAEDQFLGVSRIEIYLDGVLRKSCDYAPAEPSVECDPDSGPLSSGWHTVSVTAINSAGITNSSSEQFKVPATYLIAINNFLIPGDEDAFEIGDPPPDAPPDGPPGWQPGAEPPPGWMLPPDSDGPPSQVIELPFDPNPDAPIWDSTPIISGPAEPGELVYVEIDGVIYAVRGQADGKFYLQLEEPLLRGSHVIVTRTVPALITEADTIAAAAVPVSVAVAALAAGPAFFNFFLFLVTQPMLLIGGRRRKGYGIVFDSLTRLPVDLAVVRVRDEKTNRVVQTRVTDRGGRYGLLLPAGSYVIEVAKAGHAFPTKYDLATMRGDDYPDILAGARFATGEETAFVKHIPVDRIDDEGGKTPKQLRWRALMRRCLMILAFAGPILSAWALLIHTTWTSALLFFIQLFLLGIVLSVRRAKPKAFGVVRGADGKPVRQAVVRVVSADYDRVLESQLTSVGGRYAFMVGKGRYYLRAEAPGYATHVSEPFDLRRSSDQVNVLAKDIQLNAKIA